MVLAANVNCKHSKIVFYTFVWAHWTKLKKEEKDDSRRMRIHYQMTEVWSGQPIIKLDNQMLTIVGEGCVNKSDVCLQSFRIRQTQFVSNWLLGVHCAFSLLFTFYFNLRFILGRQCVRGGCRSLFSLIFFGSREYSLSVIVFTQRIFWLEIRLYIWTFMCGYVIALVRYVMYHLHKVNL